MKDSHWAELAREVATKAHHGQFRRDGITPYIAHPEAVASRVETDLEKAVAWLHDVVEDTETSTQDLKSHGFPPQVIEAVATITKMPGLPYEEYLDRVRANRLARAVKVADMLSNLSDHPTEKQIVKYAKGLLYLHPRPATHK
ncbi:HD domain-containing protein [Pelagicoccus albus]|uniref:HD domain-containing protein n=1 Tax=Pelagicoccus albus TaxID=415222 RepID=A0A7X1E784_9BACT|nr:HD domain-containing protein [Pelagicoccus albus]